MLDLIFVEVEDEEEEAEEGDSFALPLSERVGVDGFELSEPIIRRVWNELETRVSASGKRVEFRMDGCERKSTESRVRD